MKRAYSGDMSLLAPYGTSSDAGHGYGMSHQQQEHLEPKRPCYPEHAQLPSQAGFASTDMYGSAGSFSVAPRPKPFNMQLPEPAAFQVPAAAAQPYLGLAASAHPTQMMAAGQPERRMPSEPMTGMQPAMGGYMQQQQQQVAAFQPPPQQQQQQQQQTLQVSAGSSATNFANPILLHGSASAAAAPGSLHAQMYAQQANMRQQQPQQAPAGLRLAEDWRPMNMIQRLLPRLNQEYKREMTLLLKACQVAGKVTKTSLPATPSSGMLLLDPAARKQLQHQVLSNCNDKHAAVTAAFRVAAQAIAAAASSVIPGSHPSARAAAAAAVEVFGGPGTSSGSGNLSTLADAAGKLDVDMFAEGTAEPAPEAVAEALQQLRSSYHQELVAATSALFAICRGFGQTATVAAAASQPIKNALTAAQQQHVQVEQLWQDVLVVAAGNRE